MLEWWEENGPPVYISVASYLGLVKKPSAKSSSRGGKTGDLNELAQMFKSSGGMIQ
jgi:hypothetical protein